MTEQEQEQQAAPETETQVKVDTTKWSDEEVLNLLSSLFSDRVGVKVGFVTPPKEDEEVPLDLRLTHMVYVFQTGELELRSNPIPLDIPFMPVFEAQEKGLLN
jgi:hypothetical protein